MPILSNGLLTGLLILTTAPTLPPVQPTWAVPLFHLSLQRSEPMRDSTVTAPKVIRLWFSEQPNLPVTRIFLKDSAGKEVRLGKPALDTIAKPPLLVPVTDTLAPGRYTLTWATASSDGHAVNGSFSFTVKKPQPE